MKDIFNYIGELALGSRLKRLSDQIMREGALIYQDNNIDFEPRWFPVFYVLSNQSDLGVTDIAKQLSISHASVSQMVKELGKKQLVKAVKDKSDGRKRLVSLSEKGRALLPFIKPIWDDIAMAFHELITEHPVNIIDAIRSVEASLNATSLDQRVKAITTKRLLQDVTIVDYQKDYGKYFKSLNIAWINKHFVLEAADRKTLNHPEKIIKDGGFILFARYQGEVVGTCAMIKQGDHTYELAKMAVDEAYRGKQIGKKLGLMAIEKAKKLKAERIILESNKKLTPALNLYRRLGFINVCTDHLKSLYQRANVTMELNLS